MKPRNRDILNKIPSLCSGRSPSCWTISPGSALKSELTKAVRLSILCPIKVVVELRTDVIFHKLKWSAVNAVREGMT